VGAPQKTNSAPKADLLTTLNALVSRSDAAPGFQGTLAVGILDGARARWWRASFDNRVEVEFLDAAPLEADALLLLGSAEADQILHQGTVPAAGTVRFQGDRDLMARFIDRYLSKVV